MAWCRSRRCFRRHRRPGKAGATLDQEFEDSIARREALCEQHRLAAASMPHPQRRPDKKARGHTVSAVYVATASGEPRAQDDAKNLALYDLAQCPPLAFDHAQIIADYRRWRATGQPAPLFVPE